MKKENISGSKNDGGPPAFSRSYSAKRRVARTCSNDFIEKKLHIECLHRCFRGCIRGESEELPARRVFTSSSDSVTPPITRNRPTPSNVTREPNSGPREGSSTGATRAPSAHSRTGGRDRYPRSPWGNSPSGMPQLSNLNNNASNRPRTGSGGQSGGASRPAPKESKVKKGDSSSH